MGQRHLSAWVCLAGLQLLGCGESTEPDAGTGSVVASGGIIGGMITTGGEVQTGGEINVTGGAGSGGMQTSGGTEGTGGGEATGGTDGTGGADNTGGVSETGGTVAASGCRAPEKNAMSGNTCHGYAPELMFTEVARGLDEPTGLTHAPGDNTRLFIIQRGGAIRLVKNGQLQTTPFLDLAGRAETAGLAGERGLLGIAFDPDYATTGRFWVDYSKVGSGDTVIESFVANADGDTADLSSGQILFEVDQPAENHNGGQMAFGPDDCLYIAMGDGGLSDDFFGHGQDASSPLGGILRVDVDNYSTQQGAPGNTLSHPHLWSYGLRNPWRFSFDRASGDLYIGDVGQGAWEEVNVEPRGTAGLNYGWPCYEGLVSGPKPSGCSGTYVPPVAVQENGGTQNQSVIGGYVYRGSKIPSLVGRYLYADYNSEKVWSFTWQGDGQICDEYELTDQLQTGASISSFGEDADGELYVVVYGSGRVLRIDPRP